MNFRTNKINRGLSIAKRLCMIAAFSLPSLSFADNPTEVLKRDYPQLHALYVANAAYHSGFESFADMQNFKMPFVRLATVVHELIHTRSFMHQGYFIDGTYYEPYLKQGAWPSLTNKDIGPHMTLDEKVPLYSPYVLSAPTNHLGNVVDEINAYTHVLPFVCKNEPESITSQIPYLLGHLKLQEAYLRTLRTTKPEEYAHLAQNIESRGAMFEITNRAWLALQFCGVEPGAIPSTEIEAFVALKSDPSKQ